MEWDREGRTVQRNNADDKDQRKNQDNNGINLQSRGFVGVKSYSFLALICTSLSILKSPIPGAYRSS